MNSKENEELVKRFELYTASVVLVHFKNREENNVVVLRDIWELHSDPAGFMEEVNKELKTLISD